MKQEETFKMNYQQIPGKGHRHSESQDSIKVHFTLAAARTLIPEVRISDEGFAKYHGFQNSWIFSGLR